MRQRRTVIRRMSAVSLAALLVLSFAAGVSAHETREVGEFEFVVGFVNEPAYVNEMNGLSLDITRPGEGGEEQDEDGHGNGGEPVENAQASLEAAIVYGEDRMDLELRQVFGEPGSYTADVIPTETGAYSFEITGQIDGQEINETFTAGPDTFSEIESRDGLEFPASTSESADDSGQATAFGMAGIAAGLLGLIAGGVAYYKVSNNEPRQPGPAERRRQQKQRETE